MNSQPIEKAVSYRNHLDIHSIFHTIQGEGPFTGVPAVFVRLAGCNLACAGCDTDYTSTRQTMHVDELIHRVTALSPTGLIVVTGGEPFRQELKYLFARLIERGYYVQVETNGTLPPSPFAYSKNTSERKGVYIVVSPKAPKVNKEIEVVACCYKYVMHCDSVSLIDGLPIHVLETAHKSEVARPSKNTKIYLQPMDSGDLELNAKHLKEVIKSCMSFGYTLQVQLHKLIGMK